ncbi:hypothetical protein EG68_10447 [Paragonimus skrjabini miyazakii]|uniref:Uncharacterized protein n=1 Tax=Paragonimus skrjabini miyazakii TaxID=59628 RepID=A0A8S9YBA5_9TREM|nr:hypothetical protein EG68_10447 [Paragonimus skrjabini miyazakii]
MAILSVGGYKPLLEHNANCAAFEVKANFDSLLDALQQRQHVLLGQLEEVRREKIALIDRYTDDSRIHDLLEKAESAVLSTSSAPFVFFRNERSLLPRAIANYGRIVSRYCGHFADPGQPSTCLPLPLEEEDDHEDSHEKLDVFTRAIGYCLCEKKGLRPWLVKSVQNSDYSSKFHLSKGTACVLHPVLPCLVGTKKNALSKKQVELGDMPGLSTSLPWITDSKQQQSQERKLQRLPPGQTNGTTKDWLVSISHPSVVNLSADDAESVRSNDASSLFPAHLTQSGRIDLNKWLHCVETNLGFSHSTDVELSTEDELAENLPSGHNNMPEGSVTVASAPDCCPYLQCRRGPEGPMCCGGRSLCNRESTGLNNQSAATGNFITTPTEGVPLQPSHVDMGTVSTSMTVTTVHAAVAQLNQIAATHWSLWLSDQDTVHVCHTPSESRLKKPSVGRAVDGQNWLRSTKPVPTQPATANQDSDNMVDPDRCITPLKRRCISACLGLDDGGLKLQSSAHFLHDAVECRRRVCSCRYRPFTFCESRDQFQSDFDSMTYSPGSLIHPIMKETEGYESWLLKKMSDLSTASGPLCMGEWLTESSTTQTFGGNISKE